MTLRWTVPGFRQFLGLERVKDNQAGNEKMIEVEKDELKKGVKSIAD